MSTSIFRILYAASLREAKHGVTEKARRKNLITKRWLIFSAIVPFLLALLSIGVWKLGEFESFRLISLILLIVSYIGGLSLPLLVAAISWREIAFGLSNPVGMLIKNAQLATQVDLELLKAVENRPVKELEFVQLQTKIERESFDKRVALSIGAVEKLGLFPGLLAALVAIQNVANANTQWWVLSLAYSIPGIYLLAALGQMHALRLDRMIKVLDFAISRTKQKT